MRLPAWAFGSEACTIEGEVQSVGAAEKVKADHTEQVRPGRAVTGQPDLQRGSLLPCPTLPASVFGLQMLGFLFVKIPGSRN